MKFKVNDLITKKEHPDIYNDLKEYFGLQESNSLLSKKLGDMHTHSPDILSELDDFDLNMFFKSKKIYISVDKIDQIQVIQDGIRVVLDGFETDLELGNIYRFNVLYRNYKECDGVFKGQYNTYIEAYKKGFNVAQANYISIDMRIHAAKRKFEAALSELIKLRLADKKSDISAWLDEYSDNRTADFPERDLVGDIIFPDIFDYIKEAFLLNRSLYNEELYDIIKDLSVK